MEYIKQGIFHNCWIDDSALFPISRTEFIQGGENVRPIFFYKGINEILL